MELSGWTIYFGSFVLFFLIGFTIISHFLFEDHEIKSKIPLFIFSVVFGFAMMMLQMVFFEIAGVGTQETRYLKWVVTICALTYTSLFILPTVLLLNILGKLKLRSKTKIFISVIFGLAYLWAISNMLLEEIRVNQPEKTEFAFIDWSNIFDMFDIFLPLTQVGVLASLGMTIIAVLSGYGAVNMPVLYYNLYDEKMLLINQSTFDMRMIETVENIAAKKKLNLQLLRQLKERGPGAPQKRWTRLVNWVTGKKGELEKHIEENEEELRILKKAHNELFMDYSQFLRDKEAYTKSKSLIGKLQYLVGRILSFYCLYRIVLSIYAIIIGRGRGLDPINRFIKITLRIMNHKLNDEIYEMISAQLAFIIIGILVFINVRSFVKCIIQFFKNFGRGLLSNVFFSELIVYILTEILAMYFISTFLLMYNNFPVQHRKNMEAFFGELNFRTLYRLFDTIFLVSALAAMALIWLNDKLKKEKYTRYLQRQGSDSSEFKMKKD